MKSRLATPLALLCLWFCSPLTFAESPPDPLVPAVECRPRGGLPHFFAKVAQPNAQVRIGYLGGSITAQEGWRPKTLAYFQKAYPTAHISQINAAIGGTGSDLGVFRLQHDVLDQKPDLLFVEFAVNDSGFDSKQILRCMEGIVRQTWRGNPDCDICFVYTLVEGFAKDLQEGKFPHAASVMEKVADFYSIPSIHMGMEIARLAKEERLIFKAPLPKTDEEKKAVGDKIIFSPDGVHPYPQTGHEIYLKVIVRSLPAIEAAGKSPDAAAHKLAEPLMPDNYEKAKMIPIDQATLSAGFTRIDIAADPAFKHFGNRIPMLYRGSEAGQSVSFKFHGNYAAIYDLRGPASGFVKIIVNDCPPRSDDRFDRYCTGYRLASVPVLQDVPEKVYSVRVEISPEEQDKAALLALQQNKMDDPRRFEGHVFLPAALLIVGDLEK